MKRTMHPGPVVTFYRCHVRRAHAEPGSNIGVRPVRVQDGRHRLIRELPPPALPDDHLRHVVQVRPNPEVAPVAAGWIVAGVQNLQVVGDLDAICDLDKNSVRTGPLALSRSASVYRPIPQAGLVAHPGVAGVWAAAVVDTRVEAVEPRSAALAAHCQRVAGLPPTLVVEATESAPVLPCALVRAIAAVYATWRRLVSARPLLGASTLPPPLPVQLAESLAVVGAGAGTDGAVSAEVHEVNRNIPEVRA